ncbi:MAG TPA: CHAD domain-containing protein [Solirubrobacteraceae bacterium]|jgi:CHAD domain-containing protein|nr:CHAD domain-containing protein [Solirubrobacteraceae bacterium]
MAIRSDPIDDDGAGLQPADPVELVHEARKAIKRMRALARLLRDELGEREFARVNDSLRSAGRRLAGSRDAEVRLTTLRELIERHPRALAPSREPSNGNGSGRGGILRLEEQLRRERLNNKRPSDIDEVLADIAAMRDQLARWSLVDIDFGTLSPGLRRVYREGRHRYLRCAREHGRDEQDVHDWRKRVKSLYYALDMLGAKKAKGARRAARRADRLGDLLGSEHDLWMLCAYVEEHPEAFGTDMAGKDELLKRIEQRRRRLRKRALALGARLYKRKPGKFTRRIGRALHP